MRTSYIHRQTGKVGRTKSKRAKDEGGEGGEGGRGGYRGRGHPGTQTFWWSLPHTSATNQEAAFLVMWRRWKSSQPASLSIDHTHRCQIRSPSFLSQMPHPVWLIRIQSIYFTWIAQVLLPCFEINKLRPLGQLYNQIICMWKQMAEGIWLADMNGIFCIHQSRGQTCIFTNAHLRPLIHVLTGVS